MEESLDILDKNKLYVIAVSGGIDSMSLLDLLIKNNYNIVVAYVNHNMRKDTYKDEELVENICRKNNIRLEKIKFNYSKDSNFHDEAHNFRYNFFKKICKKYNTNNIITAHHGDDLIETILIKIFRGSNLYGYSGFEKIETKDNYTYYKPLLEYSKEDIKEYARKNNIEYLEDSTNLEDHYLRNRIRHHILPLIKKETNINKFIEYSNILKESFNYIRNKSKQIVNNLTLDEFLKQDDIIKKDIINYLFEQYNIKSNNNKINDILKILENNKPNPYYNIGNNYLLIKEYNNIKIIKDNNETKNNINIIINKNEQYQDNNNFFYFSSKNTKNNIKICYNKLQFPLHIRTRQDGDIIRFKNQTKKIKKLFIDLKIPKLKRDQILLVFDHNNNLIWIPELNIKNINYEEYDCFLNYEVYDE